MRYWRVVRDWVKVKHGLGLPELELLLFLYSEGYFKKADFNEFRQLFSWDKRCFERLVRDKWVVRFRNHGGGKAAIYQLSNRAKGVCKSVYMKLNGDEAFSECRTRMFSNDAKYMDKVFRNYMKKINQELRQHQPHE